MISIYIAPVSRSDLFREMDKKMSSSSRNGTTFFTHRVIVTEWG